MPKIRHSKIPGGTYKILERMPTSGRFNTSSMMLPMYMLAISPQTRSGCVWNSMGPGWMPYMMNAPIITAGPCLGTDREHVHRQHHAAGVKPAARGHSLQDLICASRYLAVPDFGHRFGRCLFIQQRCLRPVPRAGLRRGRFLVP